MIGRRLGHYRIGEKIGEGGMGEVFRATDTTLGRDVALKILPRAFAGAPDRLARFEREARLLASLNHPNIATLHGFEHSDDEHFLVMELVPGETLTERIAAAPLTLEEAIPIFQQIAEALEAAHERGVIHRDLKPSNVKVTPEGKVKVLDFGLGKTLADDLSASELSRSPTFTRGGTEAGVILGTAAYMSPEQARGKAVDKRTDIWSFGCVLYEALTGRKPFSGDTVSDTIASILTQAPDWTALPATTPGTMRVLLKRCLEKEVSRRLRHVDVVPFQLEEASIVAVRTRERVAWASAAVLLVGLAASLAFLAYPSRRHENALSAIRFSVSPPEGVTFTSTETAGVTPQLAVSPDGRYLAFVASAGGPPLLWLRPLGSLEAQPLQGTEEASFPFWSPDSRFIGFFIPGKLKKVEASGGRPQPVADVPTGRGGTWNRDGIIVFAGNVADGLHRVSAAGGPITDVTKLDSSSRETSHRWPQFLPDGRHFLYFVRAGPAGQGVYVGSLDSPERTLLLGGNVRGFWAAPGYLLAVRDGSLVVQPFAARDFQLSREPILLAEGVASGSPTGLAAVSASETGLLAYASGITPNRELVWFDRGGKSLGAVSERGEYSNPSLSPDEKTLGVQLTAGSTRTPDIWLLDLVRGLSTRFTFNAAPDRGPVWSPDGAKIAFASSRSGAWDLYQKASSGAGGDELLSGSGDDKFPTDWSPDGGFIVYHNPSPLTGWDLWVLPLSGDPTPTPFLQTEFTEVLGTISPDGRWIAYTSDESGAFEVYVRPFPASGGKWQVSNHGGAEPKWRQDGREIFYVAPDSKLMAVATSTGPAFDSGLPKALFEMRVPEITLPFPRTYAVAKNGQRFLVNTIVKDATSSPITVVLNWSAEHEVAH